jgi:dienelactone hydrolase
MILKENLKRQRSGRLGGALCAAVIVTMLSDATGVGAAGISVETVTFPGRDGATTLTGYVYRPQGTGPFPAVVMLHGRAGVYSSLSGKVYNAGTLSMRHRMWANHWAERGYVGILVDSFGPRGYPGGFAKHSYSDRPDVVSERTVRPLDAYDAVRYLRGRADVGMQPVVLQGWSNGGMTVLSVMGAPPETPDLRFSGAIAQYPSCRTQDLQKDYRPYAPLLILSAADDDEVSPTICQRFAARMRSEKSSVEFVLYEGAHHSYDDPGKTRQSHEPNRLATEDTRRRADAWFERVRGR